MPTLTAKAKKKALARVEVARRMGLAPSAREMFAYLRPLLLASRPVVEPAVFEKRDVLVGKQYRTRRVQVKAAVYGYPTFRNRIDPVTGKHV